MTELLRELSKHYKIIKISIPFQNNDVPNFLKELDKFEEESLKTKLEIKV